MTHSLSLDSGQPRHDWPKITVVTVCLNHLKALKATLASVLAQSYPNLEYIVVDGGSEDGTVEFLRQQENRLAGWISERDSGPYEAMNKGWKAASGELVTFLNAGDRYEAGALKQVGLEFLRHPFKAAVGRFAYVHSNRVEVVTPNMEQLEHSQAFCHQALFYQPSLHLELGPYDLKWSLAADFDFILRLYLHYNIHPLDQLICYYNLKGLSHHHYLEYARQVRSIVKQRLPEGAKPEWQYRAKWVKFWLRQGLRISRTEPLLVLYKKWIKGYRIFNP